jgi:hypothetical protein
VYSESIYQFNTLPHRFDNRDLGPKTSVAVARVVGVGSKPGFRSVATDHCSSLTNVQESLGTHGCLQTEGSEGVELKDLQISLRLLSHRYHRSKGSPVGM